MLLGNVLSDDVVWSIQLLLMYMEFLFVVLQFLVFFGGGGG